MTGKSKDPKKKNGVAVNGKKTSEIQPQALVAGRGEKNAPDWFCQQVASRFKAARLKAGYGREGIAAALDVTSGQVSKYEVGSCLPPFYRLVMFAETVQAGSFDDMFDIPALRASIRDGGSSRIDVLTGSLFSDLGQMNRILRKLASNERNLLLAVGQQMLSAQTGKDTEPSNSSEEHIPC